MAGKKLVNSTLVESSGRQKRAAKRRAYRPRTELGRRLWAIRKKIVASGERLLSWEEIERELVERRGERSLET